MQLAWNACPETKLCLIVVIERRPGCIGMSKENVILRMILSFALFLVAVTAEAQDSDAGVAVFFGRYSGTGIVHSKDADDTSMSLRNLDVEIGPSSSGGFEVRWTSLIRKFDGDVPSYMRKGLRVSFVPTGRAGVFRERSPGNPLDGEPLIWARHEHPTLTVYQLVPSKGGGFEVLSYERTLTEEGMTLVFRRLIDGVKVRTVEGVLKRETD